MYQESFTIFIAQMDRTHVFRHAQTVTMAREELIDAFCVTVDATPALEVLITLANLAKPMMIM
jgi:hypothetical protein